MKKNLPLLLSVACLAGAPSAFATIITFDALGSTGTGANNVADGYTEAGYQFNSLGFGGFPDAFAVWQSGSTRYAGSPALFNNDPGDTTEMTKVGGASFSLISIDLSSLYLDSPSNDSVTFIGTKADNSTVTNTFSLTTPNSMKTFNFSGMTNIVALDWMQGFPYHQFDNINIGTVPEPASFAVLGLGMLALIRRRKNS